MPIVLNGSTGITTEGINVDTIVDSIGTGSPSVPNGFEQMFVLPVGTLMWFTGNIAPAGYLVADGTLHSRAAYPDLWSWIVTSGNLAVNDSVWDEGQYSPGDGATTFRVPKVDDRFIRGKSGTRAVGLVEEDAFQGHAIGNPANATKPLRQQINDFYANPTTSQPNAAAFLGSSNTALPLAVPISDGINGTPRTADETRPKALTMLPCIKAFDSVVEPSVLNAAEMVSTINGKLDKDQNIVLGTSVPASGTAVDFVGIPEGVKRITVMFDGFSTNGISLPLLRIGSGEVDTSGYVSNANYSSFIASSTVGFLFMQGWSAPVSLSGALVLNLLEGNMWLYNGLTTDIPPVGNRVDTSCGRKLLSGVIDRIRITTVNGTDQFDAGTINISWEF